MEDTANHYKYLYSIIIGEKRVRFLGVNEENQAAHFPKTPIGCHGKLLFLATDVLAGTSIQHKNHIRIHTRFSKLGLASRVRLAGFKIEGIKNSGIMWFYNIKGLFRVAFELGTVNFQRDCLALLQSEWLRRYSEPLLEPESMVRFNLPLNVDIVHSAYTDQLADQLEAFDHDKPPHHPEELAIKLEPVDYDEPPNTNNTDSSQHEVGQKGDEDSENNNVDDTGWIDDISMSAVEFLEKLMDLLKGRLAKTSTLSLTQQVVSQVWIAVRYLQKILTENKETLLDSELALFEIMNRYIILIDENSNWDDCLTDMFGLSKATYSLLYVVSEWLGQAFHELEPEISKRVEVYKEQNIHNIASLPTSEETIDLLFPQCMKKLVTSWLGDTTISSWSGETTNFSDHSRPVECDHDYTRHIKRKRTDCQKVQFILEFATNSLVSGIAHVVNSRLAVSHM